MPLYQNERPDFPLTRGPHEFIEDQAALTPDAPALPWAQNGFLIIELNASANRLANFLLEQGIGQGSLVGVYLDRSLDSVSQPPRSPKMRRDLSAAGPEISTRSPGVHGG